MFLASLKRYLPGPIVALATVLSAPATAPAVVYDIDAELAEDSWVEGTSISDTIDRIMGEIDGLDPGEPAILQFGPGVYKVDRPIIIGHDNVSLIGVEGSVGNGIKMPTQITGINKFNGPYVISGISDAMSPDETHWVELTGKLDNSVGTTRYGLATKGDAMPSLFLGAARGNMDGYKYATKLTIDFMIGYDGWPDTLPSANAPILTQVNERRVERLAWSVVHGTGSTLTFSFTTVGQKEAPVIFRSIRFPYTAPEAGKLLRVSIQLDLEAGSIQTYVDRNQVDWTPVSNAGNSGAAAAWPPVPAVEGSPVLLNPNEFANLNFGARQFGANANDVQNGLLLAGLRIQYGLRYADDGASVVLEGTAAVTQNQKTVTGTGTAFDESLVGKYIRFDSGTRAYQVESVESATSLTLTANFAGTTGAGKVMTLNPQRFDPTQHSGTANDINDQRQFFDRFITGQSLNTQRTVCFLPLVQPPPDDEGRTTPGWAIETRPFEDFTAIGGVFCKSGYNETISFTKIKNLHIETLSDTEGGAIYLGRVDTVTIEDCNLVGGTCGIGSVPIIVSYPIVIRDCVIKGRFAAVAGRAWAFSLIENCEFVPHGPNAALVKPGDSTIGQDAILRLSGCHIEVNNCRMLSNPAVNWHIRILGSTWGGIYAIKNFSQNTETPAGGPPWEGSIYAEAHENGTKLYVQNLNGNGPRNGDVPVIFLEDSPPSGSVGTPDRKSWVTVDGVSMDWAPGAPLRALVEVSGRNWYGVVRGVNWPGSPDDQDRVPLVLSHDGGDVNVMSEQIVTPDRLIPAQGYFEPGARRIAARPDGKGRMSVIASTRGDYDESNDPEYVVNRGWSLGRFREGSRVRLGQLRSLGVEGGVGRLLTMGAIRRADPDAETIPEPIWDVDLRSVAPESEPARD